MSRTDADTTIANQLSDDTSNLVPGERLLLIVENDVNFARFLLDTAHEHGFKAAVATRGAVAIGMARELKPVAITLDINLPDIDGWHVLNRLKDESTTRHIPVQIITTEEEYLRGIRMGAIGGLTKPIKTKEMLDATFDRIKAVIEQTTRRVSSSMATKPSAPSSPTPSRDPMSKSSPGPAERTSPRWSATSTAMSSSSTSTSRSPGPSTWSMKLRRNRASTTCP
jgi:DNA-binding response OmpR family regulator